MRVVARSLEKAKIASFAFIAVILTLKPSLGNLLWEYSNIIGRSHINMHTCTYVICLTKFTSVPCYYLYELFFILVSYSLYIV